MGLIAVMGLMTARAADLDPAQMDGDEIKALEQRLTDAGCYQGAIDGKTSASLYSAIKVCPDQRPFLRIETGMHTAQIRQIGVDANCSLLATASWDKTVRLWSLPDGRLKKVVRLPIAEGNAGKVFATALSPDGRFLAAGGWDPAQKDSVKVIDLSSGAIRRFGAFDNIIHIVAFSADGHRIAVGLAIGGVRVFDSMTGAEMLADRDYGADVYGLTFAPDGSLLTSSFDGQLRRYGADLKLAVKRAAPEGKQPYGVAVDRFGRRVAVGYDDATSVSILDAKTLTPLASGGTRDVADGDLSSVAWSSDGATLVAGGKAQTQFQGVWRFFLRRFDAAGRRMGADVAASGGSIEHIEPCRDGFAFGAADPAFGLLSAQGVATTLQGPRTADMRDKLGSAFALSLDPGSVRFGLGLREENPVLFDLGPASLADSPSTPSGFVTAKVNGLPVTDWKDRHEPKFSGTKLALDDYELSRALAVRPDASGFALGGDFWVRAYDAQGKELWRNPGPGVAWGVDFSADGGILTAAYADGTIRWLRWSDGAELLALFVEPQSRKWVAWTPTGYYMASAGGEDLIGWHVNRGWNQEADFFPASQFRARFNRPDIVRLVLKTRDEAKAIGDANASADRAVEAKPVGGALPPVVTILSPAEGSHFAAELIAIDYALRSPSGLPVDRLDVLADGQPVPASGFEKTSAAEARGHVAVTLPKKDTLVSLIAHAGDLTSAPVTVKLQYYGPSPAELLKPKLYALLVGVTGYQNPDYNTIHFSAHDADALAQALVAQKGGLYADVVIKTVDDPLRSDSDPTRANVEEGLYWLQHVATNRDLAVVFLSGHGYLDPKQKFWFLTREADIARLRTTAISNDDLLDLIASIPGKKVLFIDACHSGAAMTVGYKAAPSESTPDMNKVVNDFSTAGSGIVVFAASTGTEAAKEDEKWDRHGAFAKALIEAIGDGKASIDRSGRITTDMLDLYLEDHVKTMTDGRQHPVMNRPILVPDFPIALAKP